MTPTPLRLDGRSLALADFAPIFEGEIPPLAIPDDARRRVAAARALVDRHVERGDVVYGLTTGFGRLKNVAIARGDLVRLQRNLVLSHCTGVGEPLPIAEVRAAQLLRLNGLLRGHSGIRVELVEALARLYAKDFVPWVPERGSVSACGDLAPLAHMAAAYMGHGRAYVGGELLPAAEALRRVGEEPLELHAKEGLALINGTEVAKAVAIGVVLRATNVSKAADLLAACSLEGLMGSAQPFEERLADLKGHEGHRRAARNVRACLEGSEVLGSHAGCGRVQDAYSLRCVPQVHGAYKAALEHVAATLSGELNSVTDNPVLFPEEGDVVSAGQFHGQPVGMLLDYLGLALCTIANVSERRVEQLVNPDLGKLPEGREDLPAFLARDAGLNSGFMIAQVTAAALCSENKVLAHPATVDTVPTSAGQEDHVSMALIAARKGRSIVENTETVLAIELLCASMAREFHSDLAAGRGVEAARARLRREVSPMDADRYLQDDIVAAQRILRTGDLVSAVEGAIGPLLA